MSYRRVTSEDRLRIKDGLEAGLSKSIAADLCLGSPWSINKSASLNRFTANSRALRDLRIQQLVATETLCFFSILVSFTLKSSARRSRRRILQRQHQKPRKSRLESERTANLITKALRTEPQQELRLSTREVFSFAKTSLRNNSCRNLINLRILSSI